MNANTKLIIAPCLLTAALFIFCTAGCGAKKTASSSAVAVPVPERIIQDYREMKEHDIVAWAWIKRGFSLEGCRSIDLAPVKNVSGKEMPAATRRIEQALRDALSGRVTENGTLDLAVQAVIMDIKTEPGMIKKWFAGVDDFPYMEIELIMIDKDTGLPLVKLAHFQRDQHSFSTVVSNMARDLRMFFATAL